MSDHFFSSKNVNLFKIASIFSCNLLELVYRRGSRLAWHARELVVV